MSDFMNRVQKDLAKQEESARTQEAAARDATREQEELHALAVPLLRQLPGALEAAGVSPRECWSRNGFGLVERLRYYRLGKGWRVGGGGSPAVMLRPDGRFDAIQVKMDGITGKRREATTAEVLVALSPFYGGGFLVLAPNGVLLLAGLNYHGQGQSQPFEEVLLDFIRRQRSDAARR